MDTTILYDSLVKAGTQLKKSADAALSLYREREVPVFAIKEMKAGPLQHLVYLHNCLALEKTLSRTIARVRANIGYKPRLVSTCLEVLEVEQALLSRRVSSKLAAEIGVDFNLDEWQATEMRISLRTRISKAWMKRTSFATKVPVTLSCYLDSKPVLDGRSGQLEIPNKTCKPNDCSLRTLLQADKGSLERLLEASNSQQPSPEATRRSRALRELIKGCDVLDPKDCRALGDALFAFFSPQNAEILTTNVRDHRVLATAIGKEVMSPGDLGV